MRVQLNVEKNSYDEQKNETFDLVEVNALFNKLEYVGFDLGGYVLFRLANEELMRLIRDDYYELLRVGEGLIQCRLTKFSRFSNSSFVYKSKLVVDQEVLLLYNNNNIRQLVKEDLISLGCEDVVSDYFTIFSVLGTFTSNYSMPTNRNSMPIFYGICISQKNFQILFKKSFANFIADCKIHQFFLERIRVLEERKRRFLEERTVIFDRYVALNSRLLYLCKCIYGTLKCFVHDSVLRGYEGTFKVSLERRPSNVANFEKKPTNDTEFFYFRIHIEGLKEQQVKNVMSMLVPDVNFRGQIRQVGGIEDTGDCLVVGSLSQLSKLNKTLLARIDQELIVNSELVVSGRATLVPS